MNEHYFTSAASLYYIVYYYCCCTAMLLLSRCAVYKLFMYSSLSLRGPFFAARRRRTSRLLRINTYIIHPVLYIHINSWCTRVTRSSLDGKTTFLETRDIFVRRPSLKGYHCYGERVSLCSPCFAIAEPYYVKKIN